MAITKLGDVAYEYKETLKTSKDGLAVVGLEHLIPEDVVLRKWETNTENTFIKVFEKGTTLFGRRRAYLKKAAYAHINGICSGDITVIKAKDNKLCPTLLPFIIQNDNLFAYAVEKSAGSLSPRVKWIHLQDYLFNLPPMADQVRLAETLWSITETLEKYQKVIESSDVLEQSMFNSFIDKRCLKKTTIKDVCTWLPKSNVPASEGKETGKYPFFTSGTEIKWIDDYLYDDECIILGNGGCASINYYCGKCSTTSHGFVIKSSQKTILTKYIYYYLLFNIEVLEEGFRGVGLKNISKEYINNIQIPVLTKEEKEQIIGKIEEIEKSKKEDRKAYDSLKTLQKEIIKKELLVKEK